MPNFVLLLWYTAVKSDGNFTHILRYLASQGVVSGLSEMWRSVRICNPLSVGLVLGYATWAVVMMKLLPGKDVEGPLTPKGNTPVYKDNGFLYYTTTMIAFCSLTCALKMTGYTPSLVYDSFGDILGTLNVFSLVFCMGLYLKGIYSPSSSDSGSTGNVIFDYYWGTELYPRIRGFDVKVFTNCRFGMMLWALLVAIFSLKSFELHGFVDSMFVSSVLQLVYISKFFWWESGYLRTIDIMLDRAGFYICWGCLVYIPGLYASVSLYLVSHPIILGPFWSGLILGTGLVSVFVNYKADMQKQEVRYANGNCLVWGRKPEIIRAKYQLENGEERESILLASGWWGLARHFHYVPELLLAFMWTVPALFSHIMPYSYVIFLLILLTHRSYRDDNKCVKKYGNFWQEYCRRVPHRIVPYLF